MGEDEESLEGFLNGPRQDLYDTTNLERNSMCLNKTAQERMDVPCPAPATVPLLLKRKSLEQHHPRSLLESRCSGPAPRSPKQSLLLHWDKTP